MSSQVSPSNNASELRKRSYCPSDDETCAEPPAKYAAAIQWYQVALESESSRSSDHDTESVLSIQDKETDYARDTSDTESETSVEYEVGSLSEDDEHVASFWGDIQSDSSSGTDDTVGVEVLAAICSAADQDSDIGLWAADTDGESQQEESDMEDNSRSSTSKKPMLLKCVQCKRVNDNPFYRYCDKCYQVRKRIFPPRPRRHRSRDKKIKKPSPENTTSTTTSNIVEPENLREYLTTLSQQHDSGIGSSQETVTSEISTAPSTTDRLPVDLNLDKIIVPEELFTEQKKPTNTAPIISSKQNGDIRDDMLNEKEMCIVCTTNRKNGLFVHGSFGHMCCCYKCAVKVWTRTKRCPACNCKVKNVLKVFLH